MNDYVEVRLSFNPCTETHTDIMAALLADAGYESFLPEHSSLTAYIPSALYSRESLDSALDQFPLTDSTVTIDAITDIEGRDWNHEWEKNYFKPIVVGDCVIHSSFHTDVPQARYDIVIDPKMSFGTGHHSTTSLMLRRILAEDLSGATVIDMGTGTAILAILAAMCGATNVVGVEIDPMAFENARENVVLNHHPEITLIQGGASVLDPYRGKADYFIANINRNVILSDLSRYASTLKPGGHLWLSGFYTADIPMVSQAAAGHGLVMIDSTSDNDWACLHLQLLPDGANV